MVLDGKIQVVNYLLNQLWDLMIDYQMMSWFVCGFVSLMYVDKLMVVKIYGYCVVGGIDIVLYVDQVIVVVDVKIGYLFIWVWGVLVVGLWVYWFGDQWVKWLLFIGDCIIGVQVVEWGLVVEVLELVDFDEWIE